MNIPETAPTNAPDYPKEFWLRTLLRWYIGLIIRPAPTIRELVERQRLGLGLLTLSVVAIAHGIVSFSLGLIEALEQLIREEINFGFEYVIVGTLFFIAFVVVEIGLFSLIVHLISKLFRGDGAYRGTLVGLMMLSILSLILGILDTDALAIGLGLLVEGKPYSFETIGMVVNIVVAIWSVILGIILIRENYRLSTGMAVLSGIASVIAASTLAIFLLILLIILLVIIASPLDLISLGHMPELTIG